METSLGTHLDRALAELQDLANSGVEFRDTSSDELMAALHSIEHLSRIVEGLAIQAAREVDERTTKRVPEDLKDSFAHFYGFPNANTLLRQVSGASGRTISRRLRMGRLICDQTSLIGESMPGKFQHVGQAFFNGTMHIDAADTITTTLNRLPSHVDSELIDLAERTLTSTATGSELVPGIWDDISSDPSPSRTGLRMHADDLRTHVSAWAEALDQDGTLPREEQIAQRGFWVGELKDGTVPVRGRLVPEVAAALGRIMDAVNNPRASQNGANGTTAEERRSNRVRFVPVANTSSGSSSGSSTDATTEYTDARTPDQKRHDALATALFIAMKHNDMPTLGGEALSLTIQVTEDQLTRQGGTAWIHDAYGQITPVDSGAARHAACSGRVLRVSQTDKGRIVSIETRDRIFNAAQRKAIMLRDGGCIIPGCTTSPYWCEIHHVEEWANGGPTHTDNGVLLCWAHHRYIETLGWEVRIIDGVPEIKAPVWIDPASDWREARSVHKAPTIPARAKRYQRPPANPAGCAMLVTPGPKLAYEPQHETELSRGTATRHTSAPPNPHTVQPFDVNSRLQRTLRRFMRTPIPHASEPRHSDTS